MAVSDSFSLGAGAFTDRSPQPAPSSLGEMKIDYYGVSTGAQIRSEHGLKDDTGHVVFSTTVALRYARGTGDVGGLLFDPAIAPAPAGSQGHRARGWIARGVRGGVLALGMPCRHCPRPNRAVR